MSKHAFAWPNGRRIAVTVTVMLKTWLEGKPPPYGVQATALKPGTIDHGGIAWGSYGGKVGVWRIIALLNRHHLRGTFCVDAKCAELFPEAVAAIVKAGHDVGGHGCARQASHLPHTRGGKTYNSPLPRPARKDDRAAAARLAQPRARLHRTHAHVSGRGEVAVARRRARYGPAARD